MGRFHVYLKPFTTTGEYESEWRDVTADADLSGITSMKSALDNTEYDVGIFRTSGMTLTLINIDGRYSDVGIPGSIFNFRRSNSMVRVTWEIMHHDVVCGFAVCGEVALSHEVIAFEGLLDDRALKQDATAQDLQFKVLGKESVFTQGVVPMSAINVGDTIEELIFKILNQPVVTDLLTVDALNIDCKVNSASDSIVELENKTIQEAVQELLRISNSVMYLEDDTIYVAPRDTTVDDKYTFYGQGSSVGNENIIDLTEYRMGLNRVINFVTWKDTTLLASDLTSIEMNGVQKKEIESSIVDIDWKREAVLNSLMTEFRNEKRELILRCPIDYDTIALQVLDKCVIDYPNIAIGDNSAVPLWDLSIWDVARFPYEVLPISIENGARFKILSKEIDPTNHEMVFYMREV